MSRISLVEDRVYCEGMTFERADDERGPLYRCTSCGRVARTERRHQVRGRNTASHDKTMESLWASAGRQ